MAEKLYHPGQYGDDNDCADDEGEIIFHQGQIAEIITGEHAYEDPGNAANYIVAHEFPVCHLSYTGYKGGKSPDDRNETCDDNCFAAIAFIKLVCLYEVVLIEESHLLFVKNLGTDITPYPVVHRITGNSSNR